MILQTNYRNLVKKKEIWKIFKTIRKRKNSKSITNYVNIFLDLTLHYDIKTFYLV